MEMVFVAGIGIALLIELLLIVKREKTPSDLLLTVWMFVVLLHLFLFFLYYTEEIFHFPSLLGIDTSLPLLHGVFLYFYAGSLTGRLPRRRTILALHFLPALLIYLYMADFFLLPADEKVRIYRAKGEGYESFLVVRQYLIALSGVMYVAWTVLILHRHRKSIGDRFSDIDWVSLRWLHFLTIGMGGIWFLVIAFPESSVHFLGVVLFVFLIGFFGVRQPGIFHRHGVPTEMEEEEQRKKYPKSGLSPEQADQLHSALRALMEKEKLYRKSELTIGDLAAPLDIHPNYLSQVINEKEGKNFYDFVNSYRIEEFKQLLSIPANRRKTLLALAFDCGFNSKSSFNRFFKKATGQTPSEYFTALTAEPPTTP